MMGSDLVARMEPMMVRFVQPMRGQRSRVSRLGETLLDSVRKSGILVPA